MLRVASFLSCQGPFPQFLREKPAGGRGNLFSFLAAGLHHTQLKLNRGGANNRS